MPCVYLPGPAPAVTSTNTPNIGLTQYLSNLISDIKTTFFLTNMFTFMIHVHASVHDSVHDYIHVHIHAHAHFFVHVHVLLARNWPWTLACTCKDADIEIDMARTQP